MLAVRRAGSRIRPSAAPLAALGVVRTRLLPSRGLTGGTQTDRVGLADIISFGVLVD